VGYQHFSSRKIATLFTEKHFGAVNSIRQSERVIISVNCMNIQANMKDGTGTNL